MKNNLVYNAIATDVNQKCSDNVKPS